MYGHSKTLNYFLRTHCIIFAKVNLNFNPLEHYELCYICCVAITGRIKGGTSVVFLKGGMQYVQTSYPSFEPPLWVN